MIKIDKYGINADANCYSVGLISVAMDKKTGEEIEVISSPKYYPSFTGCLKYIRNHMQRSALAELDGSLDDAIRTIEAVNERFTNLICGGVICEDVKIPTERSAD